jgi:hypothetical protein
MRDLAQRRALCSHLRISGATQHHNRARALDCRHSAPRRVGVPGWRLGGRSVLGEVVGELLFGGDEVVVVVVADFDGDPVDLAGERGAGLVVGDDA